MKHNYNNLMVAYYKDRIDALVRKINKLEFLLEFKQSEIQHPLYDPRYAPSDCRYHTNGSIILRNQCKIDIHNIIMYKGDI